MKLFSLSMILAVNQVLAIPTSFEPLVQRADGVIVDVLKGIDKKVLALDDAINATPLNSDAVIKQSNVLLKAIQEGVKTAKGEPDLTSAEGFDLVPPTQTLVDDTQTTIDDLIGIKSEVLAKGEGCTTLHSLQDQFEASTNLANVISSKVPPLMEDIAKRLASQVSEAIQGGIDAYQGACSGSSSAAPTSTKPTTTKGSSTPVTPTTEPTTTKGSSTPAMPTSTKPSSTKGSSTPVIPTSTKPSSSKGSSSPAIPTSTKPGSSMGSSTPTATGCTDAPTVTVTPPPVTVTVTADGCGPQETGTATTTGGSTTPTNGGGDNGNGNGDGDCDECDGDDGNGDNDDGDNGNGDNGNGDNGNGDGDCDDCDGDDDGDSGADHGDDGDWEGCPA